MLEFQNKKKFFFMSYIILFFLTSFSHASSYNPTNNINYNPTISRSSTNTGIDNQLNLDQLMLAIQNMTITIENMGESLTSLSDKLFVLQSLEKSFQNITTQIDFYKNIFSNLNTNLEPLSGIESSFEKLNHQFNILNLFLNSFIIIGTTWVTWHIMSYTLKKIKVFCKTLKNRIQKQRDEEDLEEDRLDTLSTISP